MKSKEEQVADRLMGTLEFVSYNGEYPNLCSGTLVVKARGKTWRMDRVLSSGGSAGFDSSGDDHVSSGEWTLESYGLPDDFPEDLVDELRELVNDKVSYGCCGGCL